MKVLSEREQVRTVAARWRAQYGWRVPKMHPGIQERLDALNPETATPDEVAHIIGNPFWVCPQKCHECGECSWDAVELGEEPDFDSHTANVCLPCLRKAVEELERGR